MINVVGLATGLICVLLIFLWLSDELQVDKFNKNDTQLYQVFDNYKSPEGILTWDYTPEALAESLTEELPEVELSTTTNSMYFKPEGIITAGDYHMEVQGMFASKDFFKVFSYELIEGEKESVLSNKNSIVISEGMAKKLFNSTQGAIGKVLKWKSQFFEEVFQISGIYADPPINATRQFDAVVPYEWLIEADANAGGWNGDYAETYLILKEGTNIDEFNNKIENFMETKRVSGESFGLFVQQYSKKYLYGQYQDGKQVGGRIAYVRLFSIIVVLILVMACINFMNLSTAQASKKMKEIGVKKAMGADSRSLGLQFLGESILLSTISLVIAILGIFLFLPKFNEITGKALEFNFDGGTLLSIIGILLVTGLVAGSYPAFYLSGFKPTTVLNGRLKSSFGEQWVRKGLVVFQFALSIIFIVCVIVVNRQIEYTQNKNLGYNRENIISFDLKNQEEPEVFLAELRNIPGVEQASNMVWSILNGTDSQSNYSWSGVSSEKDFLFSSPRIGYNVIETLGMELLAGRSFSNERNDNSTKIILNESALDMMSLENPIGKEISYGDGAREIIGVVKDFHYGSIHHRIEPLIFRFEDLGGHIMVKIDAGAERTTILQIEELYERFQPQYNFEFAFLDDSYQNLYEAESRVAVLSEYFTVLAIIISCLGLFGLATFTTERRKKEISIRKVLGQSESNVTIMLSREFAKLIIISIAIALPIAYILSLNWLSGFAYRISLEVWYFLFAGMAAMLIAMLTVGSRAIVAANRNPVDGLREE